MDWHQGYDAPTKYHLTRDLKDETLLTLTIDFLHNYDVMLTEDFTMEIILPFGATDIKVSSLFFIDHKCIFSLVRSPI